MWAACRICVRWPAAPSFSRADLQHTFFAVPPQTLALRAPVPRPCHTPHQPAAGHWQRCNASSYSPLGFLCATHGVHQLRCRTPPLPPPPLHVVARAGTTPSQQAGKATPAASAAAPAADPAAAVAPVHAGVAVPRMEAASPAAGAASVDRTALPAAPAGGAGYVDHAAHPVLDTLVIEMVSAARFYHERATHAAEDGGKRVSAKQRRLLVGLREVTQAAKLGKAKAIVVARNVEHTDIDGGLDATIGAIIAHASAARPPVPVLFALTRAQLGRAAGVSSRVAAVALLSFENLAAVPAAAVRLVERLRDNQARLAAGQPELPLDDVLPTGVGRAPAPAQRPGVSATSPAAASVSVGAAAPDDKPKSKLSAAAAPWAAPSTGSAVSSSAGGAGVGVASSEMAPLTMGNVFAPPWLLVGTPADWPGATPVWTTAPGWAGPPVLWFPQAPAAGAFAAPYAYAAPPPVFPAGAMPTATAAAGTPVVGRGAPIRPGAPWRPPTAAAGTVAPSSAYAGR
jgi:ribosomal protein L7Ae-like RNA K-turn-binding protein